MTYKWVLALGVGVFFVGPVNGQEDLQPGKEPPSTKLQRKVTLAQQEFKQIKADFQSALDRLQREFGEAETKERRKEVERKYEELQGAQVVKALKLAEANQSTEVAAAAFAWIFQVIVDDKARQRAKDQWLDGHINDSRLAPSLASLGMADERAFLREVVKRSSNKTVLGAACFNLAMSLRRSEDLTKKGEAEAILLLERVEQEFANVLFVLPGNRPGGRLGDLAAPPLYEFKHLSVGKIAPDVAGEDIDGGKLKLSDYRGRVVLLSFWGDW